MPAEAEGRKKTEDEYLGFTLLADNRTVAASV